MEKGSLVIKNGTHRQTDGQRLVNYYIDFVVFSQYLNFIINSAGTNEIVSKLSRLRTSGTDTKLKKFSVVNFSSIFLAEIL